MTSRDPRPADADMTRGIGQLSDARSNRAAFTSRVSGLLPAAGSSVRSITPTVRARWSARASASAGKGRNAVTVTLPTARPWARRWSTTAAAVSASVPIDTTISVASSQR